MEKKRNITKYRNIYQLLYNECSSFSNTYREICRYFAPWKGKYLWNLDPENWSEGQRKDSYICNGIASRAAGTLQSYMKNGLTPAHSPWFGLTLNNEILAKDSSVKEWLYTVRSMMMDVFARSNFYPAIDALYEELILFGTAAMIIEEDSQFVIRCRPMTIGEAFYSDTGSGKIEILYRRFSMTAYAVVDRFGKDNPGLTDDVKACYQQGNNIKRFTVFNVIQPNGFFNPKSKKAADKKYECVYYLDGTTTEFLEETGYDNPPHIVARWDVNGSNIYGTSPGWKALGDVKQIQEMDIDKQRCIKYAMLPPLQADDSLKGKKTALIPGGITYVSNVTSNIMAPIFEVNPQLIPAVSAEILEIVNRVKAYFYNDLFLTNENPNSRMTATEVMERNSEKMAILGPVIERFQSEILDNVIDRTFNSMSNLGMIPPPPKAIQGHPIKIQYISALAQVQKQAAINPIIQATQFIGMNAQMNPKILSMYNMENAVNEYVKVIGAPPDIINPDAVTRQIQGAMDQAAQKQQVSAAAGSAIEGAKTASEADVGNGQNLLQMILQKTGAQPKAQPNG